MLNAHQELFDTIPVYPDRKIRIKSFNPFKRFRFESKDDDRFRSLQQLRSTTKSNNLSFFDNISSTFRSAEDLNYLLIHKIYNQSITSKNEDKRIINIISQPYPKYNGKEFLMKAALHNLFICVNL